VLFNELHRAIWLYGHHQMGAALSVYNHLLYVERHQPVILTMLHRYWHLVTGL